MSQDLDDAGAGILFRAFKPAGFCPAPCSEKARDMILGPAGESVAVRRRGPPERVVFRRPAARRREPDRQLQLKIQDGVNNILGKANLAFDEDEDDDSLMLFTNCLPRSAGGTGEEVEEEETTPASTSPETPAIPDA